MSDLPVINLVSRQARARVVRGPGKVFRNLVKGLDEIGYPYVVNRALDATSHVWVQDDLAALRRVVRTPAWVVAGPNLVVLPSEIPVEIDLASALYVVPSEWTADLWRAAGFARCEIRVWPVGIDLDEFRAAARSGGSREVLVYHKLRPEAELRRLLASLDRAGLPYRILRYGAYAEAEYKDALARSSLVVWHGCHESQGIALEEALAADVPLLVCDVRRMGDMANSPFPPALASLPATAAPYFDDRCGRRVHDLDDVGRTAAEMLLSPSAFSPRRFIEERLSLAGQARAFVGLWDHFGPPPPNANAGLSASGTWPPLDVRVTDLVNRVGRRIVRVRSRLRR